MEDLGDECFRPQIITHSCLTHCTNSQAKPKLFLHQVTRLFLVNTLIPFICSTLIFHVHCVLACHILKDNVSTSVFSPSILPFNKHCRADRTSLSASTHARLDLNLLTKTTRRSAQKQLSNCNLCPTFDLSCPTHNIKTKTSEHVQKYYYSIKYRNNVG